MTPAIILVAPQMGENIGAAARAMANCGLEDLRLVNPRDGWPNEKAEANASGASDIVSRARLFATTKEAVADLSYVLASTARPRDVVKESLTPESAATVLRQHEKNHITTGILFGAERTGLLNDDISLSDAIITVPLNPEYTSLNLAQAVLLIGYEWWKVDLNIPSRMLDMNGSVPATKDELVCYFEHLEDELEQCDYFKNPAMRPTLVANMRAMLQRAALTEQEVRTLHGMVVALTGRSWRKS